MRAIDTVTVDFRNLAALRRETEEARRDGFTGKMAIHPAQVPVINEVFTPTAAPIAKARAVVAAFDANPGKGTVGIDGVMYDRPHLDARRSLRLLARARPQPTGMKGLFGNFVLVPCMHPRALSYFFPVDRLRIERPSRVAEFERHRAGSCRAAPRDRSRSAGRCGRRRGRPARP